MIAAILNSAILDSAICTKKLHSCILTQIDDCSHLEFCYLGFSHFAQKNFTCSFWLNLMMAAILNSAILDSAMLHKTLTQSYSIWLKVIHSDWTWWWQPSWTLPSCIQPFAQKNFTHAFSLKLMIAAILNSAILDSAILHKKTSLVHSDSTWWWQPSWILPSWIQTLPSWIQTPCYLLSDSLKNTLPLLWLWLKLIPFD